MKNETYDLRALIMRAQGALKDGFTLKISDASAGENMQVEIRDADGGLCWRMWSFEPDFDFYLRNEIERATDCTKSVENKTEGNEIMKTKQASMKAVFTKECSNAINLGGKMETVDQFILIDKKTEKQIVVARTYMGRGRSASQVKAAIWITLSDKKKPADWEYGYTSGSGQADGYGYDKASTAIADAIDSAGIELYGTAYLRHGEKVDFKKRVYFGGVGVTATRSALLAIAYAAGWSDVVLVEA